MAPENPLVKGAPSAQHAPSTLCLRKSGRPLSTSPSAAELQDKLDGLRDERSTPSTDKRVPSPLHGRDAKADPNGADTRSDSGYASLASSLSPEAHPSRSLADRAGLPDSQSGASVPKFLDKPIPQELRDRFFDLKMLYSDPLWKAVSKNKANPGDMSMKLKYMGDDQRDAQLCIIVHCEKGVSKRVKKFFAQEHVREDLSPDFQVRVINKGILRLAASNPVAVYGGSTHRTTLCGTAIEVKGERGSSFATIGGLIMASMNDTTTIYGLTAGHLIADVFEGCPESPPSLEEDEGDESDQDVPEDDDFIQLLELNDSSLDHDDFSSTDQKLCHLGTIQDFCLPSSSMRKANRDWALISITPKEWLPNFLAATSHQREVGESRKGETADEQPPNRNMFCSPGTPSLSSPQRVVIMTARGLQQGTLIANHSSLLMMPGELFVNTLDFLPSTGSRLRPGDSGSWAVNESTGEIFGHVVSVDAFGEAYVMPIQDTLQDIRSHLQAQHVGLPRQLDVTLLREQHQNTSPVTIPRQRGACEQDQDFIGMGASHNPSSAPAAATDHAVMTWPHFQARSASEASLLGYTDPFLAAAYPHAFTYPMMESDSARSNQSLHTKTTLSGQNQNAEIQLRPKPAVEGYKQEPTGPLAPKAAYQRPKHPRVKCLQCNEHPDGFRGEHELRRHTEAKHESMVKRFICVEPSQDTSIMPFKPLASCRQCQARKQYYTYYNAAAHLRRTHFRQKPLHKGAVAGNSSNGADEKRGGKGGGDWPPMAELKYWTTVITVPSSDASAFVADDKSTGVAEQEGIEPEYYPARIFSAHTSSAFSTSTSEDKLGHSTDMSAVAGVGGGYDADLQDMGVMRPAMSTPSMDSNKYTSPVP